MNNNINAYLQFDSSAVCSADYNYESKDLSLNLPSAVYTYQKVPCHVFDGLIQATSKGKFFNKYIKNNFKFNK